MSPKGAFFIFFPVFGLLVSCGPSKVEQMRAEKARRDSVSLVQAQHTLHYADSLLVGLQGQIDSLLRLFRYEKNESYEDFGRFVHPQLLLSRNASRNYLQAYIEENGRACVRACYFGNTPLRLNAVTLEADSAFFSASGQLHTFQAEGYHEWLNLQADESMQLLRFVAENEHIPIRVTEQGAWKARFVLSEKDQAALLETYRLALLMQDIRQLESAIRLSSRKINEGQKREK